ncbi:type II toxin-antitoxin system RelE/ParE family toxin [Afifella pfennigii]|uniref:type II toxin-antitoxin system RelE/ParE family toxin n=1 Tax=Afifella pfennigii TaxID=209897 RepID=UPI0006898C61|nr:type II toxin-antitoxin system RelE/ParE family toxin [Afifella pfennigii]
MRVRLSGGARNYLRAEAAYLRGHSGAAAEAFLTRMKEARRNLAQFPDLGLGPERLPIPGARRFIVSDYLLDYEVKGGELVILAIRHGRQPPPSLKIEDDFDYEVQPPDVPKDEA